MRFQFALIVSISLMISGCGSVFQNSRLGRLHLDQLGNQRIEVADAQTVTPAARSQPQRVADWTTQSEPQIDELPQSDAIDFKNDRLLPSENVAVFQVEDVEEQESQLPDFVEQEFDSNTKLSDMVVESVSQQLSEESSSRRVVEPVASTPQAIVQTDQNEQAEPVQLQQPTELGPITIPLEISMATSQVIIQAEPEAAIEVEPPRQETFEPEVSEPEFAEPLKITARPIQNQPDSQLQMNRASQLLEQSDNLPDSEREFIRKDFSVQPAHFVEPPQPLENSNQPVTPSNTGRIPERLAEPEPNLIHSIFFEPIPENSDTHQDCVPQASGECKQGCQECADAVMFSNWDSAVESVVARNQLLPSETDIDQEPTWRELLGSTIDALEQYRIEFPQASTRNPIGERIRLAIQSRLLRLSAGDIEGALEPIEGITQREQAFWHHQFVAFNQFLETGNRIAGSALNPDSAQVSLNALRQAQTELAGLAPLEISNSSLCNSVSGFGQYETKDSTFSVGERAIVYCEIRNFSAIRTQVGQGATAYTAKLRGGYQLLDDHNRVVAQQRFAATEDTSRSVRTDFYTYFPLEIPELPEGIYRLSISIDDLHGNKRTEHLYQTPLTIVGQGALKTADGTESISR